VNQNLIAKVQIRLPPNLRKRVADEAKRRSTKNMTMTVSDVIRSLIETHLPAVPEKTG
jgi:hypothetical protein